MYQPIHSQRRVVVTGIGVVSPIGCTAEEFWQSLLRGANGVSRFDATQGPIEFAGQVRDFRGRIEDFGDLPGGLRKSIRKGLKSMNRETQMAVAAAQQAIYDSSLAAGDYDPDRVGVCFGAGNASLMPEDFLAGIDGCTDDEGAFHVERWGSHGIPQIAPLWLLRCLPNMPACHVAIYNDFRGPNNSITEREASGNLAVAEAASLIADGDADVVVAGATGTTILPINRLHTMINEPVVVGGEEPCGACRPFDRDRHGSVLGEGAAALVLEDRAAAVRRGAPIYGEILGTGSSCAFGRGGTAQADVAAANAMRAGLARAGLSPAKVGHIHANGLSTRQGDVDESQAICRIFGAPAQQPPVVAAKSCTGNSGAGCGVIELVASLLALDRGRLFPVRNYQNPDPDCPLAVEACGERSAGDVALNLNLTAQGQASCVVLGKAA